MPKKTRLGAVIGNRCPTCFEGKLFKSRAYDLGQMSQMIARCEICQEDFEREPGFYFGAAYISYALTVAMWIALYVALTCFDWWGVMSFHLFEDIPLFLWTGIALLMSMMPLFLRLSRSIWLHMFTKRRTS